jgi:arylsulfatase A-like enzyme
MKTTSIVGAVLLANSLSGMAMAAESRKPNVIIVFTDDQGYQDLGVFGSPNIRTPNIDRMAKEGMRFTAFY